MANTSQSAALVNGAEEDQYTDRAKSARQVRRRKYPCSAGQRRFWVLDQLEPLNSSLHLAMRWRLEGEISVVHLEKAFHLILARHEVLRTSFLEVDGEPVQVVEPDVPFRIRVVDLTSLSKLDAGIEAERLAYLEAREPFYLGSAPPFIRMSCLHLGENVSILLVTAHHIVCDNWSIGIFAREMGEIYSALQSERPPALVDLPVNYGDFCALQSAASAAAAQQTEEAFWRQVLKDGKHFEVPPDKPRPPVLTNNGNILSLILDRHVSNGIADIGQRYGCTFFMTTLAALLALLHRYTGETDIRVGTQVAGRDRVEVEDVIGLFTNTLVLRNDLSGNPSFSELLTQVRNSVGDSFDRPHMPLEKLIEIVRPTRDRSRNPLFSVNYFVQSPFMQNASYGGLSLIDMPPVSTGAMYELNFFMAERPDGWHLSCEYNTDLYESETITRLLRHFQNLLRAVVNDPTCRISALQLLDEQERRTLLVDWNQTGAGYPQDLTVSRLFKAQAARTPDSVAVVCGEKTVTYRQLDLASNRLALQLGQRGLEPGRCIGVFLNRSVDLVTALIAVHKAGFAYVPLDPGHPPERLKHIIADAGLVALITDRPADARLPLEKVAIIQLKDGAAVVSDAIQDTWNDVSAPDHLAYVIYTSGSTGQPKGVEITHRSLVNLLCAMAERPGLTWKDVLLAVTTVSFDIAALELFLPLLVGARLVVATEKDVADGSHLKRLIEHFGVTAMQATPASWRLLLEAGFRSKPGFKMLVGGEALPRELADRLLDGGGELWNMYGPTETTIWSSCAKIERDGSVITVGRPIANTQFYILDNNDEPVPPGVPGLLYIGGDGVGLCYHNKPQLTAEKFIASRFGEGRIYSTGDLARWLSGGDIQILGRNDDQIKLRGFRIEPGEIESILILHPEVAEAVVILGEDVNGEGALRAYVAPRRGHAQDPDALIRTLRTSLGQALPGYMCPASITLLDAMPQTQNGKIDRRALPEPTPMNIDGEEASQPLNDVERRVAGLWGAILGMKVADKRANFFELGGHSLLAVRLLVRINAEFGQRFSLATLFEAPTLVEQARLLERGDAREYDFRQVVRLQANGVKQPLIAINNTGIYYTLSKRLGPNRPFTTLQLFDPSLPAESLPSSFEEIAAGYVQLIRSVQHEGPYALLGWCVAGSLAFEIAQQLCESGQRVSQLVLVDAYAPGYLTRLSALQRLLADYSHRWKLIALDWSRVRSRRQSLIAFLGNREFVKKLLKRFSPSPPDLEPAKDVRGNTPAPEVYDQWLLNYLDEAAQRYEPRPYPGKIVLFRSAEEPSGRFLDFEMGWGPYAGCGIEVTVVDGDHFNMFQDPSATHMAREISAALDSCAELSVSPAAD